MRQIRIILALMLVAVFASACASRGVSEDTKKQQSANKATEKFYGDMTEAREGLEALSKNIQKALDDYNSIVELRAKDPRKTYGELVERVAELDKSSARSKDSYQAMYSRAQEYYNGWKAELDTYSNPDLKQSSEERYNVSKTNFDAAHQQLVELAADLSPFVTNLNDQTRFLGRDLSPEAVATLGPQKDGLNQQANDLREKAEKAAQDLRERAKLISGKN